MAATSAEGEGAGTVAATTAGGSPDTPTSGVVPTSDLASDEASFLRALAQDSAPSAPREPDRIGARMGRYVIRARLGAGGMGVVYRADDEQLARPVALKVLRPRGDFRQEQRRRFVREARAASAVRHPNVASVYEVGEHGEDAFIAMELVPGDALRARLRSGPVPIGEAARIGAEIARALKAAHAAGVVHRDLKPDNVIIEPDGMVKVLDFGLARWSPPDAAGESGTESLTEEGVILGTPGYMSPEQISGHKGDARCDLFSLGVVLFELLLGRRPFQGASKMEILVATSRDAAPNVATLRPDVSRNLARLVAGLLSKNPDERPTIEVILEVLASAPSEAPRGRGRLAVAVGVLAVALVGGLVGLRGRSEPLSTAEASSAGPPAGPGARSSDAPPSAPAAERAIDPGAPVASASAAQTLPAPSSTSPPPSSAAAPKQGAGKKPARPPGAGSSLPRRDQVWDER